MEGPILRDLSDCNSLLHCDFNPKNILVHDSGVSAILDWEFSSAGHPLADIGNFLRFEEDYPPQLRAAFLEGYEEAGGALPGNWEAIGKVLDFAAIATFLTNRPEEALPLSAKTAIGVIERTARFLGR